MLNVRYDGSGATALGRSAGQRLEVRYGVDLQIADFENAIYRRSN